MRIGSSDLDIFPLNLGGNVFGWTADREESFAILDAFVAGGGDFIDTSDSYSAWVPGNTGGDSERIIGEWLASRHPSDVVVATKVSQHPEFPGLGAANIRAAAEASLERLGVEAIDLYYAHYDDADTPLEETVAAFGELVADGLVRYTAVSNYTAERLAEWIRIARDLGVAEPVALQPHYNLVERGIEADLLPLAHREGLGVLPYFSLAKGFLAGKYRSTEVAEDASPRAAGAAVYVTDKNLRLLDEIDRIAAEHDVSAATVSLAWLRGREGVTAPIASASRVDQVAGLLQAGRWDLPAADAAALTALSD